MCPTPIRCDLLLTAWTWQTLAKGQALDKKQAKKVYKYFRKSQSRPDPFRGTGFCSADNVCH